MTAIDGADFTRAAKDLGAAPALVQREVRAVVSKGALNVKKQLQSEMGASRHFRGAARDITYDLIARAGFVEAEIGPRSADGDPGNLANIAYFGTSRGGGTVPDPMGALEVEAPKFEKALLDLVTEALK